MFGEGRSLIRSVIITQKSQLLLCCLNWFLKIWMMLKDNVGSSHVKDLNGSSVEMSTSPFTDLFLINVQFEMG